jgi:hypothetical protein
MSCIQYRVKTIIACNLTNTKHKNSSNLEDESKNTKGIISGNIERKDNISGNTSQEAGTR